MGTDGAIQDKGLDRHRTSHRTSGPPLKQKKSLTRLFTASRSSSKSRAASSEDRSVPTTPTIPERYLCAPRKASGSLTDSPKTLVQPVLENVAIPDFPTNQPLHSGNQDCRGTLKLQPEAPKLARQASGGENSVQLSPPDLVRTRRTKASSKRSEDKLSTHHSPSTSAIGQVPIGDSFVNGPSSPPHTRYRGASTASPTLSRSQDAAVKANIPSRPSTSGGESRRGQNKESELEDSKHRRHSPVLACTCSTSCFDGVALSHTRCSRHRIGL